MAIDDRELLLTIAFAEGWAIDPYTNNGRWRLSYEPSNWQSFFDSQEAAEDYMIRENDRDLDSVDAALSLPWPFGDPATEYELVIRIHDGKPYVDFIQHRWTVDEHGADYDDWALIAQSSEEPLARALCECFYAWWKEAHHAPKP